MTEANLIVDETDGLSDDVTLITAYFNIGDFPKGDLKPVHMRSQSNYSNWMGSFRHIHNPVVAFFDYHDPLWRRFKRIRKAVDAETDIKCINRNDLWTFKILKNISKIFNNPKYPKHYPNTVIPAYACVSSSRFELVKIVIDENPFKTRYFAWVDIGYFRRRLHENQIVKLGMPHGFNRNKISFTEIVPRNETLTASDIVSQNINWVAAGYFTGHYTVLHQFVTNYLLNLDYFLSRGVMAAEQQMIYAMVNTEDMENSLPEIQTYGLHLDNINVSCNAWFYLGCVCWKNNLNQNTG
jgi:hypothetical protein